MPGEWEQPKNYVELTEDQIFDKIKEDLTPIQENLAEKKITINEAKFELKKINEWLQWTKLEEKDKKEIWRAFDKLTHNLEKSIEENGLKTEFNEVVNLLENLIQKDLITLKWGVQQNKQWWNSERPTEVQEWINEASNDLASTINDATKDKNRIARKIGERMENLMA